MIRYIIASTLALTYLFLAFGAEAEETVWQVDKAHSEVGFTVKHLGLSKVHGSFKDFNAKIYADKESGKITKVLATVKIPSIDSGIEARDNHLLADDFFAAEKFPTAKLVTKSITLKGEKVSAVAELTLKGVTKTVIFDGEFLGSHVIDFGNGKNRRAGYSVSTTINRKDFGLSFNKVVEGITVVGDNVKINLEMEIYTPVK